MQKRFICTKNVSKIPWIVWCSPQMNISKQNVNYNFNFFKAAKPFNSEFLFVNKNSHRKRSRLNKTHFLMLFNGTHINQIVNQLNMKFRRVSQTWASLIRFLNCSTSCACSVLEIPTSLPDMSLFLILPNSKSGMSPMEKHLIEIDAFIEETMKSQHRLWQLSCPDKK